MSEPNPFRDPLSDIPEMAASWTERLHRSTGSDKPKLPRQEVDDVRINSWSAYAPPPWGGACCLYRRKSSASEARTSRRSRRSVSRSAISSRVPRRLFAAIRRRILSANELLGSRPARTCMFQDICAAVCDVRFTSIRDVRLLGTNSARRGVRNFFQERSVIARSLRTAYGSFAQDSGRSNSARNCKSPPEAGRSNTLLIGHPRCQGPSPRRRSFGGPSRACYL
jgi:hypothetical protein